MNAETAAALYLPELASERREPPAARERTGSRVSTLPHPGRNDWLASADEEDRAAAFDATLERCRPELLAWLCVRVQDEQAAADLVQETYMRVVRYRDDPQIVDLRLVLFRTANNLAFNYLRNERRHYADRHMPLEDASMLVATQAMQEDLVAGQQTAEAFKQVIRELPPKCRTAFLLSRYHGKENAEIAVKMEISVKMVEKHIARALVACRAVVGQGRQ